MRTFIFLLSTIVFSLNTENSLAQNKVTIDADKLVSIDEVFKIIMNQTEYNFIYPVGLFEKTPKIQLRKGTVKVGKLLSQSIGTAKFNIILSANNNIVIKPKTIGQQRQVSGTVTDENDVPLVGATVQIKGTKKGVITDFDGSYTIRVSDATNVLEFSSLGYKQQEIVVGSKTTINLKMIPKTDGLDEVVVIGYGTSTVKDATGVISRINSKDIANAPMGASVESLLQGKAAGVNVQIQSASPTSPISVIIRGASSLSGDNQPLWVIDGVPQAPETTSGNVANTLYNLNLNDIQSIDILKDASATGIYGSRAANGVVIVTTKRGKPNTKPRFEISSRVGLSDMDFNGLQYFNAEQYKNFTTAISREEVLTFGFGFFNSLVLDQDAFEALRTNEFDASDLQVRPDAYFEGNTLWQDIVTRNPVNIEQNFSVRGGSERSNYFVSFNHRDQEGIVITGDSKIYGGRLNFETNLNDNIKFGLNLTGSTRKTSDKDHLIDILRQVRPDLPEFNEDGTIATRDIFTENPHTSLLNTNSGKGVAFSGTAFLDVKIVKNLRYRSAFSNTYRDSESLTYNRRGSFFEELGTRGWSINKRSREVFDNTLTYTTLINKKHDIKVLAGYSTESSVTDRRSIDAENFPDDDILNNFGSQATILDIDEFKTENALVSQFARLHYKFDDRYIISGTIRRDGSSRFGADRQYGTFPSAAAAWLVTGENFMKSKKINKYVSYLKLRASIGLTGSQNLGNFDFLTNVNAVTYNETPAIIPTSLGNPQLQWEETELFDLGLDFGLFDDRVYGSVGIYQKKSDKLIFDEAIPWSSSFQEITANVASTENKGVEFDINYDIIRGKDQRLTIDFNFAKSTTRLTRINGNLTELIFPGSFFPAMVTQAGEEIGEWVGLQTAGRFYVNAEDALAMRSSSDALGNPEPLRSGVEQAGDLIFIDQNGDGVINDEDRVKLGTSIPKGYGGFGLTYQYKGFRINTTFTYAYGHKRLWRLPLNDAEFLGDQNNSTNLIAGQSTTLLSPFEASYPRLGGFGNDAFSDFYLHNASFLRLNALNMTYKLPNKTFKNSVINGVDITFQATNLFTITKYPGFDPQGGGSEFTEIGAGQAIDESTFPSAKIYSLGIIFNLQ
ncbi:MAG: SusC/RagA family TonB-linked outer membrane protein [Algibacter sp.]